MTNRDPDLDRLTTLLGQCLGRIDEQSFRLQRLADDEFDDEAGDVLENEAARLQELVGTLIEATAAPSQCDLNRIVEHSLQACLAEVGRPIVVRQRLDRDLPQVACGPSQCAFAVQRALVIALGRLEAGDEVIVTTRREDHGVVLELESRGDARDRHLQERTVTLCEFVAGLRGHCRIEADPQGALLLVLELPHALAIDEY